MANNINSVKRCEEDRTSMEKDSSHLNHSQYYYLSPKAVQSIPHFQYDGADHSLIYKYILSPLAAFLVQFTPNSIAPNTITSVGLFFMVSSYLLFWYQCPTIDECTYKGEDDNFPNWIFLFNTASMLIYQTLDNMDGKHARKTNSSSPLGLLFDHGCDAINSLFGSVNWIIAMGLSLEEHSWQCWVVVIIPMIAFYTATWEEYYTSKLILPVFNGPSEGLLMGASLSLASFWYGRGYWHGTDLFDTLFASWIPESIIRSIVPAGTLITNYNLIVWSAILSGVREISDRVANVVRNYGTQSIINLFPIMSLAFLTFGIPHLDIGIVLREPRLCFHLCSCLFVEMTTGLMLDHIGKTEYQPQRMVLLPLFILILAVGAKDESDSYQASDLLSQESLDRFLLIYTVSVLVWTAMKFVGIIHEICCVLGIWCFDIVSPHPHAGLSKKEQ